MLWSILICSLVERKDSLERLLLQLDTQLSAILTKVEVKVEGNFQMYDYGEVEILIMTDNRELPVGSKRNLLIDTAIGQYISFIDDDDLVGDNYASSILNSIKAGAGRTDVIVFEAERFENGRLDRKVKYGTEFHRDYSDIKFHYRLPNHLMVWKREIALKVKFRDINFGEDSFWARDMKRHIRRQQKITEVLYFYLYSDAITATRHRV